ncbi:MAG TPA: FAD-dependent oxidoreductase [Vicinamibacterales bacterium]|nr:FAD-dependent oxidoreductase [Vicinamibacterales bacterium]
MSSLVTVPLMDVMVATPRSRLVTLDLQGTAFTFLAGQAVVVGGHGQPLRRPYSIACSPERAGEIAGLELLVGLDASGAAGPHLTAMVPGSPIDVQGPLGAFTFPESLTHRRLLFVAGGTGIAPLRSMLDHALRKHPAEQISLLYSARRADEFAFIEELRAYEDASLIELHPTVTRNDHKWKGGRGRIGRSHFEAVLHDRLDTLCFICGPPTLVNEAVTTLTALGVPRTAIRTEEWTSSTRK